jgi:hypothetical protein
MTSRRTTWMIAGLILAGVIERLVWLLIRPEIGAGGEALIIAQAVSEGRGLSDAFHPGAGPTAHMLPISPLLAGGVYALLGFRTLTAEFVLASYSIALGLGCYLLLYRIFRRIGVPRAIRVGALAWGMLAPPYISQETIDFRVWEGGLGTFLAILALDRLLALDPLCEMRLGMRLAVLALVGALAFFVNPPLGLAAIACMGVYALRHLPWPRTASTALIGASALAAMVTPWAIRNEHVMGAPILLRSNAGLELSLTNYPGAENVTDDHAAFMTRLKTVHPSINPAAFARMRQVGGEYAYANMMGSEAKAWIADHPAVAARQALHRARQMLVPSTWQFDDSGTAEFAQFQVLLAQIIGVLGLVGMILAIRRYGEPAIYPTIFVLVMTAVFAMFQPTTRYTYMIYPVMVNLAACVASLAPGPIRWAERWLDGGTHEVRTAA